MATDGGFDPTAAVSGQDQGNAFSGIYTDLQPADTSQDSAGALEYAQANRPLDLYEHGGPPKPTDPATYEKFVFSQIANDPNAIKQLQQQLKDAGYNISVTGLLDAQTDLAYTSLLQDVSVANQSGQVITPEDYLKQKVTTGGGGIGDTTTQTSTDFTSATDARAAALQAFSTALGKRPTQHQMDAFYQALHAYEAANPTVTSQTKQGVSDYATTTNGGAGSADSFAQQYVDQNFGGEVGTHDAVHYFNIIASALSGPPGAQEVV